MYTIVVQVTDLFLFIIINEYVAENPLEQQRGGSRALPGEGEGRGRLPELHAGAGEGGPQDHPGVRHQLLQSSLSALHLR